MTQRITIAGQEWELMDAYSVEMRGNPYNGFTPANSNERLLPFRKVEKPAPSGICYCTDTLAGCSDNRCKPAPKESERLWKEYKRAFEQRYRLLDDDLEMMFVDYILARVKEELL